MPANPNPHQSYEGEFAKLTMRVVEYTNQLSMLVQQHKAAIQREEDLRQQHDKLQKELSQLGLMQLGRRMRLRAEQDNISKKILANQQLQDSILAKQEHLRAQRDEVQRAFTALKQDMGAAPVNEVTETAAPVEAAPAAAPAAPAPAAKPAAPVQRAPRTAPRRTIPRAAHQDVQPEPPLPEAIEHLLTRLEALYPEHQVFALDSLNADLRDRLGTLTARSGHATPADFLEAHGWQMIGPRQALTLRRGKHCTPGEEPEVIRPRLDSVLSRLEKHYPDRVIARSIQHDHKSLAQDVSGLYLWLGYDSIASMLTAYGFRYEVPLGGRPATDVPGLLETLKATYAEGPKPRSIARIAADHPELASTLKTLQNQAPARFGMSLRQYLAQEGVLAARDR